MSSSFRPDVSPAAPTTAPEHWTLEELLQLEGPRLLSYFARRVQPAEDAADLLSETFIVAWRRQAVIPADHTEARRWLYGVARKVLATHRRGAARRSALADRLREELSVTHVSARADGSAAASSPDPRIEALPEALDVLTPGERDLIALVHMDGFSLTEAAVLLHQRPGTIRSRYHRARSKLKAAFELLGEIRSPHITSKSGGG